MTEMMSLDDIIEVIRVTQDVNWFLTRFEISIEDLVTRFKDLIEEQQEILPYDLEFEKLPEPYDDRECG